jgi:hypothetical protein
MHAALIGLLAGSIPVGVIRQWYAKNKPTVGEGYRERSPEIEERPPPAAHDGTVNRIDEIPAKIAILPKEQQRTIALTPSCSSNLASDQLDGTTDGLPGNSAESPHERNRFNRKILLVLVLACIGCALCSWVYVLFPSRSEVSGLPSFSIMVNSRTPLNALFIEISRSNSSTIQVKVWANEAIEKPWWVTKNRSTPVAIELDSNSLLSCSREFACQYDPGVMNLGGMQYDERADLTNRNFSFYGRGQPDVTVSVEGSFGFSANGNTALVMLPSIDYEAPGHTTTPGTLAVSAFPGCYGPGVLCVS